MPGAAGVPALHAQGGAPQTAPTISVRQLGSAGTGSIGGVAYDSLLMKPMANVSIELVGSGRTSRTDPRGKFSFDKVPAGEHQLTLGAPALDTLGFGALGVTANVLAGKRTDVQIATPSLRTMWNRNCLTFNTIGIDSGIVWGTIRDAATQKTLSEAAATFHWYDLRAGNTPGLLIREMDEQAHTNAEGVYFACGLPSEVAIGSEGLTKDAASGRIDYALGARRMQRLDLTVSTEMVVVDSVPADAPVNDLTPARSAIDSGRSIAPRGTATVRGRVLNEDNKPVANALVAIVNLDSAVRSDASGQFRIAGVAAGTQLLNVRRVGSPPVNNVVHLRPGQTADVDVVMSSVNTLTTVNVRAARNWSKLRLDFEQRKKNAFARVIEGDIFEKRADMYSVLDNVGRFRMTRNGFGLDILIKRPTGKACTPFAFLDGLPIDANTASSLPVDMYRAVEIYENPFAVPAEYYTPTMDPCGTILFWTKRIKW
ncbi:MAG: carboxypeptidase-like regulatory domain-containing protein [Gemmatimonas sp.]